MVAGAKHDLARLTITSSARRPDGDVPFAVRTLVSTAIAPVDRARSHLGG